MHVGISLEIVTIIPIVKMHLQAIANNICYGRHTHIKAGFFLSMASSFMLIWNSLGISQF